jgi:hypothetical protein
VGATGLNSRERHCVEIRAAPLSERQSPGRWNVQRVRVSSVIEDTPAAAHPGDQLLRVAEAVHAGEASVSGATVGLAASPGIDGRIKTGSRQAGDLLRVDQQQNDQFAGSLLERRGSTPRPPRDRPNRAPQRPATRDALPTRLIRDPRRLLVTAERATASEDPADWSRRLRPAFGSPTMASSPPRLLAHIDSLDLAAS